MNIKYEKLGNGPERVIVVHDWMSTHHSYAQVIPYLSADRFSYVFPDLRGYGRSGDLTGEYSAAESAQDILTLADELGWDKYHFIGHSMSGMIGQRLCLDAAKQLKSLVLVTPVTAAGVSLDESEKKLFEAAVNDDESWLAICNAVTSARLAAGFYKQKLEQHRAAVKREAFAGYLRMWTRSDFSAEMRDLRTPLLVIAGAHDFPAFSVQNYKHSLLTWFTNSSIELFENAGHYPMSETPPYFARVIEDFIGNYSQSLSTSQAGDRLQNID